MCRTVTLTVKSKDLKKVLESLEFSKEFEENTTLTLTVDIEDTKKNYQTLCNSNSVLYWDFEKEDSKNKEEETSESENNKLKNAIDFVKKTVLNKPDTPVNKIEEKEEENTEEDIITKIRTNYIIKDHIVNYNDVIEFILISWRLSKRFDSYSIDLLKNFIVPRIIQSKTDISEVNNLDKRVIQLIKSYYSGVDMDKIIDDVTKKVRKSWTSLKTASNVNSLISLLFKPSTPTEK